VTVRVRPQMSQQLKLNLLDFCFGKSKRKEPTPEEPLIFPHESNHAALQDSDSETKDC